MEMEKEKEFVNSESVLISILNTDTNTNTNTNTHSLHLQWHGSLSLSLSLSALFVQDKERLSSDQLHYQSQKWKQEEQHFSTKITKLEADLASSIQLQQQLHRKVQFLEDENYLHQTNLKHLNETINSILQAKEAFLNAYQESTCEMKRSIESRDTKIAMLSHKIHSHLDSLDSIRKDASSVNQLVDNAHRLLADKEEVVAHLKIQMYKVCEFERLLIEKNNDLEAKLKIKEDEFHKKERVIAELQTQLETAKITDQFPSKIEEISTSSLSVDVLYITNT
ncbi:uncharacterized protein LOC143531748 [Bidens hawaiensis]|uniref:uncharacterized protein LOC143531748 n=1 Tax=Bidens hawaiensis TaxID=980011 RepID=UPI00404AA11C